MSHPPFSEFPLSQLRDDLVDIEGYIDFAFDVGADLEFLLWLTEERRLCIEAILGKDPYVK